MTKKPHVAFFDFACCEGCQVELTNYGDEVFLELLKHINLVEFREVMSEKYKGIIDIACIEGSFTREADRARLLAIRQRSNIVIAYGQCASSAGINALKNHQPDYHSFVYKSDKNLPHLQSNLAQPISSIIKVDYQILGCPINRDEFINILSHVLHAKQPIVPNYPVCVECKRKETICHFEKGGYCLGMVARAGCGAPCPADGIPCEACRGFVDNPNLNALESTLRKKTDLSEFRIANLTQMYNGFTE